MTFADPLDTHYNILDEEVNNDIYAYVEHNLFYHDRRPPNFESWLYNWRAMHGQSIWSHLPAPSSALMHYAEEGTASELGQLFLDFIPWLSQVVFDGTVVDIVHGSTRSMNTEQQQRMYGAWVAEGRFNQPPDYDPTQPLVWKNRMMIIADPFVKCRNVAVGLHGQAMYKLRYEVAKARRLRKRHMKGTLDFLKMAQPSYGRFRAEMEGYESC